MSRDAERLGLAFPPAEDRRLLASQLSEAGYEVEVAAATSSLPPVDCLLVGPDALRRDPDELAARREAADPSYLPVLLVVTGRSGGRGQPGQGSDPLAGLSPTLAELVDDAVVAPVRRAELDRRVEGLLRARRLSTRLAESRDRYQRLLTVLPEAVLLLDGREVRYCNDVADALLVGRADPDVEAETDGGADTGERLSRPESDPDANSTDPVDDAGSGTLDPTETAVPSAVPPDALSDDRGVLVGRSFEQVVAESARPRVVAFLEDIAAGRVEGGEFVEVPLVALDGRELVAEVGGTRVEVGGEELTQLVVRDVTERREREERLRLYRRAMDEASVGVTIADASKPDNPLVYANAEFARLTGRDTEWLLGRNARFAQGDETDPETVARLREAIDAEEPVGVELRNERADGTEWWNALDVTPVRDEDGAVSHFIGFQRDVTERRRRTETFERLHEATERLQGAFDVETVTDVAVETTRDVLGLPLAAFWRPGDGGELQPVEATEAAWRVGTPEIDVDDPLYEVYEAGEVTTYDLAELPSPEAVDRAVYIPVGEYGMLGAAAENVDAYPDYLVDAARIFAAHVREALERADREAELRARERDLQRYETVVAAAGDPIYTLDADGRFTEVNDALVGFTGLDRETLIGSHVSIILDDEDVRRCEAGIRELVYGDESTMTAEVTVTTAAGEARECEINIALLPTDTDEREGASPDGDRDRASNPDPDPPFGGTVGVIRDITARERRRQRLAVLDRVLRHNIRNKINVVHGRAEQVQAEGDLPPSVSEDVAAITDASEELLDVAEKARAFHRSLSAPPRTRDLVDLIEAALRGVDGDGTAVDTSLPAEASVIADDGLELAIDELLSNAFENASDPSAVHVRVGRAEVDGHEWVELAVGDDGDGIPRSERAPLDGTVESSLAHGSGIGLWLVAWSVRRAGGRVTYDQAGDRTTVVLLLPPA
jgi:PAS domain S-box-containing protein